MPHIASSWIAAGLGARARRRAGAAAMALGLGLGLLAGVGGAEASEPSPWAPPGATVFAVGEGIETAGVPMRIQGFVSPHSPDRVAQALRDSGGSAWLVVPRAEGWVHARIEGRRQVTVQLQRTADGGTRGLWAVVDLADLARVSPSQGDARSRLMRAWLPQGGEPPTLMRSRDGSSEFVHLSARHRIAAQAVVDHLESALSAQGYRLEHDWRSPRADRSAGRLRLYRGPSGEAVTAIVQTLPDGATATTVTVTATSDPARPRSP